MTDHARTARLAQALAQYGSHTHFCELVLPHRDRPRPVCTCGFADAMEGLGIVRGPTLRANPEAEQADNDDASDAWDMLDGAGS